MIFIIIGKITGYMPDLPSIDTILSLLIVKKDYPSSFQTFGVAFRPFNAILHISAPFQ
jgi:hypothetical protein